MDWKPYLLQCQNLIQNLANLTKTRVSQFYPEQYKQVMQCLERAFKHNENNSLLLLARSKQIIHSLVTQVERDLVAEHCSTGQTLKVVRVNTTLLNANESKILMRFCETLGMQSQMKTFYTVEMITEIQKYFQANPNVSLLFVFEDIDYYLQATKQVLLYKIFDMLQYCQIKFVFVATSMKVDIVDSFEKRIKSRFSHRQVLLYEQTFDTMQKQLTEMFKVMSID